MYNVRSVISHVSPAIINFDMIRVRNTQMGTSVWLLSTARFDFIWLRKKYAKTPIQSAIYSWLFICILGNSRFFPRSFVHATPWTNRNNWNEICMNVSIEIPLRFAPPACVLLPFFFPRQIWIKQLHIHLQSNKSWTKVKHIHILHIRTIKFRRPAKNIHTVCIEYFLIDRRNNFRFLRRAYSAVFLFWL